MKVALFRGGFGTRLTIAWFWPPAGNMGARDGDA